MDTIRDFEDILALFERYAVRYLIVGGLAVTFHAMPRYTKTSISGSIPTRKI